ncbi:hypothetical protein GCM10010452_03160 [Crossiella cryophila]
MWPGPRLAARSPQDWLVCTIVKIVTSYTRPGDRVLLLAAPRPAKPVASIGATRVQAPWAQPEYSGLLDARWAVFRLGRTAQTRTDAGSTNHTGDDAPKVADTEPGPEPRTTQTTARSAGEHNSDQALHTAADPGTGSFDLIITAVEPTVQHHPGLRRWASHLTGRGTVAVITHSHLDGSELHDPTGAVVRSAEQYGLRLLDHLAVLGTITTLPHTESNDPAVSDAGDAQSFTDILVFTAALPGTTARDHRGDLR